MKSFPLLLCLVASLTASGAPITWSPAVDTTGKAQLLEGVPVLAFSGGTGATVTGVGAGGGTQHTFVGGDYTDLVFVPAAAPGVLANASNGAASTGDVNFDTIIKSLAYTANGTTFGTQTIGGLEVGTNYLVQVFFNDQRNTRVMTFGDGEAVPNTVDVAGGNSAWGQFAVGSFVADGSTQALTQAADGFGNLHVNAILVTGGAPAAPVTPDTLVAVPGNNRVSLAWEGTILPGFKEYRIKRSAVEGGPYTRIGTSIDASYTDATVLNGSTWYYVVTSVNLANDESGESNEAKGEPQFVPEPVNFLFIITDDQDTYSIGAYRETEPVETQANGDSYVIDTPHIDRLAAEGMLFHQARLMGANSGAVCTPSRTCIMTGRSTWERTVGMTAPKTFPGIFNRGVRNGKTPLPYATYRTCKNGNSYPTANGEFNTVRDSTKRGNSNGNGSEWHGENGIDFIADWEANHRANGKPFFIYLGFSHPHDTRNARTSPDLVGRYNCTNATDASTISLDPDAPPLPINALLGTPAEYPVHPFDHGHLNVRDEVSVSGVGQYRTEAVIRNEIGRNFACVDWIDQQIGLVLSRLEDPNGDGNPSDSVKDNTYIVFTSDHGMSIGRHGLQGKQNLYEHTWRVPYIVRGPGIEAGSETDALVYLHDTFPTFADFAGLDLPNTIDGNDGDSFRAVLEGTKATHRSRLHGIYAGGSKPGMRAVTDGRFKLIKYDVSANASQVTQLFDLQSNPFELLPEHGVPNLATRVAYAKIRQRLEEDMMAERILNADPYAFLGDRTLFRFENDLTDRFPYENHGVGFSATGGALNGFSLDVPATNDFVVGEANLRALNLERDLQQYIQVPDSRALSFGANPFTIEAWVKLETTPTGDNAASSNPVVMKKVIGEGDGSLDYMFLATAGSYGDALTYTNLALSLGTTLIVSDLGIDDTEWHYISVAFDPVFDRVRFVVDDATDEKSTTANGATNNGPLTIGAHFDGTGALDQSFDGLIDELSIIDGFLAPYEMQPLRQVAAAGAIQIIDVAPEPVEELGLTFTSDPSRLYRVQRSPSLAPADWTDVRTFIPGALDEGETSVEDLPVDGASERQYFRISSEE